jgi:hypothetical protein
MKKYKKPLIRTKKIESFFLRPNLYEEQLLAYGSNCDCYFGNEAQDCKCCYWL